MSNTRDVHTIKNTVLRSWQNLVFVTPCLIIPLTLGWNNENDMRVVDVKYDEYALIHTIKTKGGVTTTLNKLYGEVTFPSSSRSWHSEHASISTLVPCHTLVSFDTNCMCSATWPHPTDHNKVMYHHVQLIGSQLPQTNPNLFRLPCGHPEVILYWVWMW